MPISMRRFKEIKGKSYERIVCASWGASACMNVIDAGAIPPPDQLVLVNPARHDWHNVQRFEKRIKGRDSSFELVVYQSDNDPLYFIPSVREYAPADMAAKKSLDVRTLPGGHSPVGVLERISVDPFGEGPRSGNGQVGSEGMRRTRHSRFRERDMYLSDLAPSSLRVGWGKLQKDKNIEGGQIVLNGRRFLRGLGAHAPSRITYNLQGEYSRFRAYVGINDSAMSPAQRPHIKAKFSVRLDDELVYSSPALGIDDRPEHIDLDIQGRYKLTLVADAVGRYGIDCRHTIWADARLTPKRNAVDFGRTKGDPQGTNNKNALQEVQKLAALRSALYLYKEDYKKCPGSLEELTPKYIKKIPHLNLPYHRKSADVIIRRIKSRYDISKEIRDTGKILYFLLPNPHSATLGQSCREFWNPRFCR